MGKVIQFRKATKGARFSPTATRGLRAAGGRPKSYDPATRTFEACLASEKPCRTYRWTRGWDLIEVDEILPMSGLAEIGKLRGASLLNSHSSWRLSDVIGVIEDAWIDGDKLMIRARLSERPDVDPIANDIETGILNSLSVGFEILEDGEAVERAGKAPLVTVKRWKALEGSVVPVPADDTAKIRAAVRFPAKRTGASDMDAELLKRSLAEAIATAVSTAIDAAVTADEAGDASDSDADLEAEVEEFRAAQIAKRASKGKTPAGQSDVTTERSAQDKATVAGLRAACAKRGLKDEFEALETSGATVAELRGVLVAGLRTNATEIDGSSKPSAPKRGKLVSFDETSRGKAAK